MIFESSNIENYYIASLCLSEGIGSRRAKYLLQYFGSAKAVWSATTEELKRVKLPPRYIEALINFRHLHPNCPEQLFDYCELKKIKLCSFKDDIYPKILKHTDDCPVILYYRGELKPEIPRIAIVGTRLPTTEGKKTATRLAEDLARNGITIVSGAAYGIDIAAHEGALKKGRTVAILGCGLEASLQSDRKRLLEKIAENGAVISEYSPNTNASKSTFPIRNRIIAGLSIGVVVVEAGESSGAMNTAQHAGDYGRLLFAVPSSIYNEKGRGCHELIRDGAILTRNAGDILEYCNLNIEDNFNSDVANDVKENNNLQDTIIELPPLEGNEEKIFNLIQSENGISPEEISMQIDDIDISEITTILLNLDMNGYISENDFGKYICN